MIKELFDTLVREENQRETLSKIRGLIKEGESLAEFKKIV